MEARIPAPNFGVKLSAGSCLAAGRAGYGMPSVTVSRRLQLATRFFERHSRQPARHSSSLRVKPAAAYTKDVRPATINGASLSRSSFAPACAENFPRRCISSSKCVDVPAGERLRYRIRIHDHHRSFLST